MTATLDVPQEQALSAREDAAETIFDVTIIGGGPVGLFGAFYAGLRQLKTKIIDSLPELGGQLSALYPEKYVFDMPGFPKVLARDLARDMAEQAMRFNPTVCLSEMALELEHEPDGTIRITTQRARHRTRALIIATGAGAFSPKRLDVVGVEGAVRGQAPADRGRRRFGRGLGHEP